MRKLFSLLLLLLACIPAGAVNSTSNFVATITITNAPTTNGQTLTVSGNTRTWTNSVFIAASQIKTNSTIAGCVANLASQVANTPFSGISLWSDGLTYITLTTATDVARPTITLSSGWASLTWGTNRFGDGTGVRVPAESEPNAGKRTNNWSEVARGLLLSTNPIVMNTGKTNSFDHTIFTDPSVGSFLYKGSDGLTYGTFDGSSLSNITAVVTNALNSINATNFFGTLSGTNWSFSTVVNSSAPTNIILDCKGAVYQKLVATNNVNIQFLTNGPGGISLKIFPNGSDRTLTVPTNWVLLDTNNWRLSGSLWARTITNASNGSGPRWFWLSAVIDDATSVQTNVVANGVESP